MRLQFAPTAAGGIAVTANGKRAPAVTDSGVTGAYVASDALGHLLNMNKISNDWECGPVSMAALQNTVVAEFGAAASAWFGQAAGHLVLPSGPELGFRSIRLNDDGNIELDLFLGER